MKRRIAIIMALLPMALLLSVASADDVQKQIERKKRAQEELRQRIRDDKKKGEQIRKKERSTLHDLQKIDRRIDGLNKGINQSRSGIKRSEGRIALVRQDLAELEVALQGSQERLGRRLRQMYKSGKTSALSYLLNAEGPADFQRRLRYVRSVAAADAELIRKTRTHKQALSEKQVELEVEAQKLARNKRQLENGRGQLVSERGNKEAFRKRITNDRLLLEQSILEMKAQAVQLDGMLTGLYRQKDRQVIQAKLAGGKFGKQKGHLPWPVRGKVIHRFGRQKYPGITAYSECAGIKIKARHGTPVKSIAKGKVLFADWYTGYGKMVVVDHGDGYGTVYTHASEISVSKGQDVAAGEVIAKVGSTESLSGDMLYFQLRHYGKPLDPWPWLTR
jgi:septal ring factor EnvC (AmiA/AmiB activator)